jgi:hypothetical protein
MDKVSVLGQNVSSDEIVTAAVTLTFHVMWKSSRKPNPLTPFPTREGGKFKVSLFKGREK